MPFTPEQKQEIIAYAIIQVATGRYLSRVFKEDTETDTGTPLPTITSFWRWVWEDDASDNPTVSNNLARAREAGIEALLDRAMEIAETPMEGEVVTTESGGENGTIVKTRREDMLGHRKLVVDTAIKAAQMMKPKKYGPKLDLTTGGEKLTFADHIETGGKFAEQHIGRYQQGEK